MENENEFDWKTLSNLITSTKMLQCEQIVNDNSIVYYLMNMTSEIQLNL